MRGLPVILGKHVVAVAFLDASAVPLRFEIDSIRVQFSSFRLTLVGNYGRSCRMFFRGSTNGASWRCPCIRRFSVAIPN